MSSTISINIISNFLSRIWLALISLVSAPYIVTQLGVEAYAVLSLSLLVVGYFTLLDLGLGKGIVKFLAEFDVKGEKEKIKKLTGTSLVIYTCMGGVGAVILSLLTNTLVTKFFNIPLELHDISRIVFYITSLGLIFRIPQIFFTSILLGYQKIHSINTLNVIFNTLRVLITLLLLNFGFFLIDIVVANLCIGIIHLIFFIISSKKLLPDKTLYPTFDKDLAKILFKFSLNAFISDFMGVIIVHFDKFLIGIFLPIANLTYYSLTFQLASFIWEVPQNVVSAIYPVFSGAFSNDKKKILIIYTLKQQNLS